jgi:hypothetical protein
VTSDDVQQAAGAAGQGDAKTASRYGYRPGRASCGLRLTSLLHAAAFRWISSGGTWKISGRQANLALIGTKNCADRTHGTPTRLLPANFAVAMQR